MNKISQIAALLITLTFIICTAEAKAQAFLNPISSQAPSFLEQNAVSQQAIDSTGAQGFQNNSDNLLTTQGAYNAGVVGGSTANLQQNALEGLMAPNSVNNAAFPSGSYSYGFTMSPTATAYAGQALPVCSTGSCDLNIVNCPNLLTNYGANQYNPWSVSTMLVNPTNPTLPLDLEETASEAALFINAANGGAATTASSASSTPDSSSH
jgi:hypothetical protein